MKLAIAISLASLSLSAVAADYRINPNPLSSQTDAQYRSSTGTQYQYDLSRPADQLRYEVDPRAQLRDNLSVDPRRDMDRSMGQVGGGVRR